MAQIGYARVSTSDQVLDAQLDALRAAGCAQIFQEHASGADRDRPELARALAACRKGDVLIAVKLDRIARSQIHLLQIVEHLQSKGADFRSLGDPIDTTSIQGRLMFGMLAAFAEFERGLISERTKAALRAAAARGRKGGNPMLQNAEGRAKLAEIRRAAAAARAAKTGSVTTNPPPNYPSHITAIAALCRNGVPPLRTLGRQLIEAGCAPPRGEMWHPPRLAALIRQAYAAGLVRTRNVTADRVPTHNQQVAEAVD